MKKLSIVENNKGIKKIIKNIVYIAASSMLLLFSAPTKAQDNCLPEDTVALTQESEDKKLDFYGSIWLESINHAPIMGRLFQWYGANIAWYGQMTVNKTNTTLFLYQVFNSIDPTQSPNFINAGIRQKISIPKLKDLDWNAQAQVFIYQHYARSDFDLLDYQNGWLILTTLAEYNIDKRHAVWLRKSVFLYGIDHRTFEGVVWAWYNMLQNTWYMKLGVWVAYQSAPDARDPWLTLSLSGWLNPIAIGKKAKITITPNMHLYYSIIKDNHPALHDGIGVEFVVWFTD